MRPMTDPSGAPQLIEKLDDASEPKVTLKERLVKQEDSQCKDGPEMPALIRIRLRSKVVWPTLSTAAPRSRANKRVAWLVSAAW